jgi:hypothetical protein
MTARISRWFKPSFSIGNLLTLTLVVGLCLAWYIQHRKITEQAAVIDAQQREITRLTVSNILLRDATDEEKAKALLPYIKVGDQVDELLRWANDRTTIWTDSDSHFDAYRVCFGGCGLWVDYLDGRILEYGYVKTGVDARGLSRDHFVVLASDLRQSSPR